jgi:hypothetical protein
MPGSSRLATVVAEAREAIATATTMEKICRDAGKLAITGAIDAGSLLNEAKGLIVHGKWRSWLKETFPDVSYETVCRWIRLSNLSCVTDLTSAETLTQAYHLCGILKDPVLAEEQKSRVIALAPVNIVTRSMGALRKRLRVLLDDKTLQLNKDDRNQLKLEWTELEKLFADVLKLGK